VITCRKKRTGNNIQVCLKGNDQNVQAFGYGWQNQSGIIGVLLFVNINNVIAATRAIPNSGQTGNLIDHLVSKRGLLQEKKIDR